MPAGLSTISIPERSSTVPWGLSLGRSCRCDCCVFRGFVALPRLRGKALRSALRTALRGYCGVAGVASVLLLVIGDSLMATVYGLRFSTVSIWYGLDRVPEHVGAAGTVVTIGVFDGVHCGHQELVSRAVAKAKALGVPSVMFTFEPHPTVVFRPDAVPALLQPVKERARLAEKLGIDHVIVLSFTEEISSWSPAEYVQKVLVDLLHARAVIVGQNFTYGHKASGTPETLVADGERLGIEVDVVPLLQKDDHTVSSTWVRGALTACDVAGAARALGRPFSVRGEVTHGAGRGGRALGFPTANLYFPEKYALPADAVYAGYVTILPTSEGAASGATVGTMPVGTRLPAAISVGTNPTFGHEPRSVESFILDHDADLYGLDIEVEFIAHLRDQATYEGMDELIAAIGRDVEQTRKALS